MKKEQDELEQTLASDQASLDQFNEDTDRADKFLALAKKYTDFSELTAPMINEFVEKIVVHAPDRSTGERIQEIEIYLKFNIGKIRCSHAGADPGGAGSGGKAPPEAHPRP